MNTIGKLLLIKSATSYIRKLKIEHQTRETLFNTEKTPKQAFSFLFFIVLLGQIGIITSTLFSTISGNGLIDAVRIQATSGNFLTFEISLIFSCVMLYFQEYGDEKPKILFCLRITYLIAGLSIAFLAMLNYIYISTDIKNNSWGQSFIIYNISLYVLGIYISYKIYMTFSVAEETTSEFNERTNSQALERADNLDNTKSFNLGAESIEL